MSHSVELIWCFFDIKCQDALKTQIIISIKVLKCSVLSRSWLHYDNKTPWLCRGEDRGLDSINKSVFTFRLGLQYADFGCKFPIFSSRLKLIVFLWVPGFSWMSDMPSFFFTSTQPKLLSSRQQPRVVHLKFQFLPNLVPSLLCSDHNNACSSSDRPSRGLKRLLGIMVYLRWSLVTGFRRSWDAGRLIVRLMDVPSEEKLGGRTAEVSAGRAGLLGLWGLDAGSETPGFRSTFWAKLTDFGRWLPVEAAGFGLSLWGMLEVGLTGGGVTGEDLRRLLGTTALLSETR